MTIPLLMVLLVLLVSILLARVLAAAVLRQAPPWASMLLSLLILGVVLPGIAHADNGAGVDVASDLWKWIGGGVLSTLGGIFGLNKIREKARQLEAKVIDAAKAEARNVGLAIQHGIMQGVDAFDSWSSRFEGWVTKQGISKLPKPVRAAAASAAHSVFQELHIYADQAGHEAVKQLSDAVKSIEAELPKWEAQVAKFPSGTASRTTGGQVSK